MEYRKGFMEEEYLFLISGVSLLVIVIVLFWVWWFSRFGNCIELYGMFLYSGILIGLYWFEDRKICVIL